MNLSVSPFVHIRMLANPVGEGLRRKWSRLVSGRGWRRLSKEEKAEKKGQRKKERLEKKNESRQTGYERNEWQLP